MIKRIFTFWTVVLSVLLIFVLFFFDTFRDWGAFAEILRIVVILSFIIRSILLILLIIKDRKEEQEEKESLLSDLIIERKTETLTLQRRGLR